jgi:hypothetical protein
MSRFFMIISEDYCRIKYQQKEVKQSSKDVNNMYFPSRKINITLFT